MAFVVDDRTFVIGLCELFRQEMKAYEVAALLPLAERATRALGIAPADVPIEGYYGESPELTRFFRLVRALQALPKGAPEHGDAAGALERLRAVFTAPAMGRIEASDRVLPRSSSPFGEALEALGVWSIDGLAQEARRRVNERDCGLVAVAAASGDPVALCVARESVALVSDVMLADPEVPRFEWAVSEAVASVARRFVASLAAATGIQLPAPTAAAAEVYGPMAKDVPLVGRCILIGNCRGETHPQYHWYVGQRGSALAVFDFFSNDTWTTDALRALPSECWPAPGARLGGPASVAGQAAESSDAPKRGWFARMFGGDRKR